MDGTLFFEADDGVHGDELWMSDGTKAGTVMVTDIKRGTFYDSYYQATFPSSSNPSYLTAAGGKLYFTAKDGVHGDELWMSDGTGAGTVLVKDINRDVRRGSGPYSLIAAGGRVYFTAIDGNHGRELWTSDGTKAGTVLVKDTSPCSNQSGPDSLARVGTTLFFAASDSTNGTELWKSDGTRSGTVMVKDINTISYQ